MRNSAFSALGTFSTFVIGFLFAGLTIRYLGTARSGYLMTLQALLALNALVGGFGLGTAAVRRVAVLHADGAIEEARAVVGAVSFVNTATGLVFFLGIVFGFPAIYAWSRLEAAYRPDAFVATLLIAGGFLVGQAGSAWQTTYQSLQRYDLITLLNTAFGLMSGVAGIAVLRLAPSMAGVAAVWFALSLARFITDAVLVRHLLGAIPRPEWKWRELRPMLRFGGWTYLSSLGGFLFTNADRLVLTAFLGSAAMPYYVIPQRLYSQIHSAVLGQYQFLYPMFSALGTRAAAEIERLEDRLRWFTAVTTAVVYSCLALLGPIVLSQIVSPEFAKLATIPLILACVQGFLHAQMVVPYYGSWALGQGAPNTVAQLLNGGLVLLSVLFLVPRFGYVGASVAQLWIGPVALLHTLFVTHLRPSAGGRWRWLGAYASPGAMLVIWLAAGWVALTWKAMPRLELGMLVGTAGIGGFLAVWLLEKGNAGAARWDTLLRAVGFGVRWLVGPRGNM